LFKKLYFLFFIFILLTSCNGDLPSDSNNSSAETTTSETSTEGSNTTITDVDIATWNIRILSNNSRDDVELGKIASLFDNFDFVAIQEVRDATVLNRLKAMLSGWDYIVSDEVGNTVKERYAYFYKTNSFSTLGTPYIFGDPENLFIREPYIAHFRTGTLDFTIITIHTIYGDTVAERRAKNALLDDVISLVDIANGAEGDVLLMGDFNLPADDSAWEITTHTAVMPATIMTTITDTSSYDNFWVCSTNTSECAGTYELIKFDETMFSNDDSAASLAVSDHRPLVVDFSFSVDDDAEGNWTQSTGLTGDSTDNTIGDLRITSVVTQPTESESITIMNYSTHTVDLTPWTLGDLNDPDSYNIPNSTTIGVGQSKTYGNSVLGFGINNTGETIYLKRSGVTIDVWP
jgi:endonuclease/exonuclease/phosphatase family metal-dependent hydrolase